MRLCFGQTQVSQPFFGAIEIAKKANTSCQMKKEKNIVLFSCDNHWRCAFVKYGTFCEIAMHIPGLQYYYDKCDWSKWLTEKLDR